MADKGIEIAVTLNADGSIEGLEALTQGLEKIRAAAAGAGDQVGKMNSAAGGTGGSAGGGRAGSPETPSFWESRMGQVSQSVIQAGMTFVERSIPKMFDPYSTSQEKLLEQAPIAARLAAQTGAGATIGALETKIAGTGIEIPEALKTQFIQTLGTLAEEAAKRAGMFKLREERAGRAGTVGMLSDLAAVGVLPDEDAIKQIAESFKQRERRMIGMERAVAEALGGVGGDDFEAMKQKTIDSFSSSFMPAGVQQAAAAGKTLSGLFG